MEDYLPVDMEDDDDSSLPRLEGSGVELGAPPPPLPPPPPMHGCDTDHCQDVGVWACSGVEWTHAIFPNLLGQGPREAEPVASKFWHQLHTIACSHEFRFVVCGVLAPPCAPGLTKPLPPCREVCDSAMKQCLPIMEKYYLFWPEDTFTCQELPYSHQEPCLRYHQGQVVFPPGVNTDCSHQDYSYEDYDYEGYDQLPALTLYEDHFIGGLEDDVDADLGFISSRELETYELNYETFDMPPVTNMSSTPSSTTPRATLTTTPFTTTSKTLTLPSTTTSRTLTTSTMATPSTTLLPDSTTPRIRFAPTPTSTLALLSRSSVVSTDYGTSYLHGDDIVNDELYLPGPKGEKGARGPRGPPGESTGPKVLQGPLEQLDLPSTCLILALVPAKTSSLSLTLVVVVEFFLLDVVNAFAMKPCWWLLSSNRYHEDPLVLEGSPAGMECLVVQEHRVGPDPQGSEEPTG
ncbi:uncharacterized protein LOC121866215 [Homarus americanus]|uniref:uncharacterized protein LOC121866215 n=1 Tax=Homarus americanus TaxID=6706 RepID=UPI001C44DD21|nr:uncharacterized protein LOC121866215 [Homarus americanus]